MKYIKLIESVDTLNEIKELCDNCLAYLIDRGFTIKVTPFSGYYMIRVDGDESWEDIRDEYLFFIDILLNDYILVGRTPFEVKKNYAKSIHYTLDGIKEMESQTYFDNNSTNIVAFIGKK